MINGLAHHWGYRNFAPSDSSRNIAPWGLLIGGEELHNNHHAYITSARFSSRWWELDIGWGYIRILAWCHLVKVRYVAPKLRFEPGKPRCDGDTLQSVITHRFEVLARFDKSTRAALDQTICAMRQELAALWSHSTASKEQLVEQLEDWCVRAERSGIITVREFARKLRCYA